MERSIEEIKELWKAETDEWVWKAATKNINEYPVEVQAIIKAEAVQRVLSGKNPERPIVTAKNKPKPLRLKAKTQLRIGLIYACFILVIETYNLVNGQLLSESSAELSGYLIKMGTLSVYVTALVKRKIRVVEIVYRLWVWLIGFECVLFCRTIVLAGKRAESLVNPITVVFACAVIIIPYLIGIYMLKTGLCGLTKLIENQET